jgi:hypothetical protein
MSTVDLTQRPPRSPRVKLGGFVMLPRILDKCRATLAGKNGEYNYNCPADRQFFDWAQVDADKFKAEVKTGKGDGEMLDWVLQNAARKLSPVDAMTWSAYQEQRAPGEIEKRDFFHDVHKEYGPKRTDIVTWFDLLDLDDYVTFGGKA